MIIKKVMAGLFLAMFVSGVCFAAEAGKSSEKSGAATVLDVKEYKLANKSIARIVVWADGKLATKSIENLLAGQKYDMEAGDEFQIQVDSIAQPITAASAKVTGAETRDIEGGKQLVLNLADPALAGAAMRVVYELKDADFFGRKWIEIDPPDGKNIPVAALTVESMKFPANAKCSYQAKERGQPVYVDDVFLGLEWPGAANTFARNAYSATHWPAWDVEKGFASKRAVWGAAPAGEVGHWFIEKYIPAIRMSPLHPLLLLHQSYMSGKGLLDKPVRTQKIIAGYRDNLLKKHGVGLDVCYACCGWWKSPGIYEEPKPDAVETVRKMLQADLPGCEVGLYAPFCATIYDGAHPEWSKQFGYEITGQNAYCMLGSNYVKKAQDQLRHYIVDLGVCYFSEDNYNYGACKVEGHGHRTAGGAAREGHWRGRLLEATMSSLKLASTPPPLGKNRLTERESSG